MKKCFTINPLRTTEDINSYHILFENNLYQAVEIFYPYNLDEEKQKIYTENIQNLLKKYPQIEIVMHLPHGKKNNLCDIENFEKVIKLMKDAINYSHQFAIKKLTLHLGYANPKRSREDDINHIVCFLKDLCGFADKYQMQIMIENMPSERLIPASPLETLDIIKKVNCRNLRFILDTGHANVSGFGVTDFVYILKEYLFHLHINDNFGKTDEHSPIGKGNINFIEFFKALHEINYQELFCLEILFNNVNDLLANAKDISYYDIFL